MKYLDRKTMFHHLDPRTKIILSIGCAALIIIFKTPLSLFILFIILFLCFLSMKPPVSYIKNIIRIMAIACFVTTISQGFFYYFEPKTPLIVFVEKNSGLLGRITGGIAFYIEGMEYGIIQSMRLFSATLISMIIVMSTHPSHLLLGLKKFGISEKIGFALTISIRFLPMLIEEAKRIMIAQRLRGLKMNGIKGNFKRFHYLVVPLIIDSLRQGRKTALAAEVRGFRGKRTEIKILKFTWLDGGILFITATGATIIYRYCQ